MAALALLLTVIVVVWPIMNNSDLRGSLYSGEWAIEVPLNVACLLSGSIGVLVVPMPGKTQE